MKILSAVLALALAACSKPADPTGTYLIKSGPSLSTYDIQSSGAAKIFGSATFYGTTVSWNTAGRWTLEDGILVVTAPKPENLEPGGRITEHRFTIEPNGDLIAIETEELNQGVRAVKQ
jgi:hypothetical protein